MAVYFATYGAEGILTISDTKDSSLPTMRKAMTKVKSYKDVKLSNSDIDKQDKNGRVPSGYFSNGKLYFIRTLVDDINVLLFGYSDKPNEIVVDFCRDHPRKKDEKKIVSTFNEVMKTIGLADDKKVTEKHPEVAKRLKVYEHVFGVDNRVGSWETNYIIASGLIQLGENPYMGTKQI